MADANPTGPDRAIAVRVPAHHQAFLREALDACRNGVLADLKGARRLFDTDRVRREADAYGRLSKALDNEAIVADEVVVRVLAELADAVDDLNEYPRVVAEHRALCTLLGQIEEGRHRWPKG
jgi:hypothetical protein